jgi:curved DNA-binding protein CbpA
MSKYTIAECLAGCGITSADAFDGCQTVDQEFARIKSSYLTLVLVAHPDKGGNVKAFIVLREHWDVVRVLYDEERVHASGFPYYLSAAGSKEQSMSTAAQREADGDIPSWAWFEAALHEPMPGYRCEAARSAQSKCKTKSCEGAIAKGGLRCGSMDKESGVCTWLHSPICLYSAWISRVH